MLDMRRREFITLLGGAVVMRPFGAWAQPSARQPKNPACEAVTREEEEDWAV